MFKFLDRVREKPRHKRQQFAFVIAFSVTLVIVVVWVISFRATIGTFSIPNAASLGDAMPGGSQPNEALSNLQQIIDTAKSFEGLDLQGAGEDLPADIRDLLQNNSAGNLGDGQEGVREKPKTAEPKRVLIATTSSKSLLEEAPRD